MEERRLYFTEGLVEAGCDEAGRGCLAGPVVAAAVVLPADFDVCRVNDSKQLNEEERLEASVYIKERALAWAIAEVDNVEIDKINILKASIKAMHKAVDKLKVKPQLLLIDGNRFYKYKKLPHECIIKGDSLFASIAAASILAKTHRDALMVKLHKKHPHYGWLTNKGYPTPEHQAAIQAHGITTYHRRTYAPVSEYLQLQIFETAQQLAEEQLQPAETLPTTA